MRLQELLGSMFARLLELVNINLLVCPYSTVQRIQIIKLLPIAPSLRNNIQEFINNLKAKYKRKENIYTTNKKKGGVGWGARNFIVVVEENK